MTTTKHLDAAVQAVDVPRRRIRFVASQRIVDRDGEVIERQGIDTSEFAKNPTLLCDHDPRFVLGRVEALTLQVRPNGEALIGEAEILPAGTSARVDEAWSAITFSARNGISIGFTPLEVDPAPVLPGQRGVTYKRVRLLEISSVALPACPTCVVESKRAKGGGALRLDVARLDSLVRDRIGVAVDRAVGRGIHTALCRMTGRVD
jgi:phage head maturation protease